MLTFVCRLCSFWGVTGEPRALALQVVVLSDGGCDIKNELSEHIDMEVLLTEPGVR